MGIVLEGTFPVSALNVGLAGVPPALGAKVAALGLDVSGLTLALTHQIDMQLSFPPNLAGLTAAFGSFNVSNLAAAFNPANWVTANAGANTDLGIKLALIEAQLAIVTPAVGGFRAGLAVPGLAGWSYAGRAAGFGTTLAAATAQGVGKQPPGADVQALIIGTDAFTSWGSFSAGFNTGTSSSQNLGPAPAADRLSFLGELSGAEWNTGLAANLDALDFLLVDLQGTKASLEGQILLSLGVNLPDPSAIISASAGIDLSAALSNLVNVQTDLGASIGALNANISAVLSLAGSISAALSAGGLTFWSYTGRADGLGAALAGELAGGLPGVGNPAGPAYGLVIAATPANMSSFGSIFKVA